MNTRGRFVVLSSVVLSLVYFAVAAPAAGAAPNRAGTSSSLRSAADPAGGTYVPVPPARILDTRIGVGAPEAAVAADATLNVTVGGAGRVPSTGVSAVVVNLTVTQEMAGGYLTAFAAGHSRPVVSDISFPAAQTRAHLVVVQPGADGQVSLYNGSDGTVQLIADVSGYYTAGSAGAPGAFTPVTPTRLVDTRVGLGAPQAPVYPTESTVVDVLGHGGVPQTGVSAVMLNVTVTASNAGGYEAIHHYATNLSVVNFQTGITASNLAVTQVDPLGHVTLYNGSNATFQLVVDVFGYYAAGAPPAAGLFGPDGPRRLLDTRSYGVSTSPIPAHHTLTVPVVGVGVPADATAVALNVTVPGGPASGYLSVYAAGTARPVSSTVNFQTVSIANLALTALGANGAVTIYNGSAKPANVVLDVAGYVGAVPGPLTWSSPQRIDTQTTSVSCPSTTFCMVVDYIGDETTYNGSTWSGVVATPDTGGTDSVSCVSPAFCVAVGNDTSSDVYRSGTWTAVPIPGGNGAGRQVSCVSTTFCMAVDVGGDAYAFNGTTWGALDQLIPNGAQMTVSCVSATFCMAGGEQVDGEIVAAPRPGGPAAPAELVNPVFQWDGSHWSSPTQLAAAVESISCSSTEFCLAASLQSSVVYDGSHWSATARDVPPGTQYPFNVLCLSSAVCLGLNGLGTISTYTSSGWSPAAALDSFGAFTSIACPTSTFCVALDDRGDIVIGT